MSASNVQMNWSAVTFNSITLNKITSGTFNMGGQLLPFAGDQDLYPTVIVNNMNNPGASFTSGNIALLQGIAVGTTSTLLATLNDAKGATGGAINYTLINAVYQGADASDSHAQYGSGTANWLAFSSDGITTPLSFTRS
jgi:hypothetical protein